MNLHWHRSLLRPLYQTILGAVSLFSLVACQGSPTPTKAQEPPVSLSEDALEVTPPSGGSSQVIDIASSPVRGPANAKVTVVEYSNFRCHPCATLYQSLESLAQAHPNDMRLIFKHGLLGEPEYSYQLHEAAQAAKDQQKFWEYASVLFSKQPAFSLQQLRAYTEVVGLDPIEWSKEVNSQSLRPLVMRDFEEADRLGHQGTPVIYINGQGYFGITPGELTAKVEEALR